MDSQRPLGLASPEQWHHDDPSKAVPVDGPSGVSDTSVPHSLPLTNHLAAYSNPLLLQFLTSNHTQIPSTNVTTQESNRTTNIPPSVQHSNRHGQPHTQEVHYFLEPTVQELTDSLAINIQTEGPPVGKMSVAAVAPQDSESSPSTEEEQRFWDKLYASPRRTPSVTKGWSFEEQEVLERPASSTCEPILDDQEYTDNDIEHQTLDQRQDEVKREGRISQKRTTNEMDAGDHYPIEGKRPRRSYQLQKKLQIIEYWTKNPQSYSKIAKHFHVPRMTVHGIIKNKAILQQLAESSPHLGLTLETSRVAKLHFAVLEELLLAWILDLKSRRIPVSGHKITTQAFEIHRMLSGLLLKPLPPCQFSSGWLKNFKNRRQISLRGMHSENTNDDDTARAFKELHAKLDGFNMRSIYWCDMTSMFLGAIPTRTFQRGPQENYESAMDTVSVSVLLCSNVFGCRDVKPLVLDMVQASLGLTDMVMWW
ncbi:hypothetical protein EDD21DRAFT_172729 [Dissophora ornata]|nr:hypothetical protein EDD21DRAFT_172729 [Dissophora ornata]